MTHSIKEMSTCALIYYEGSIFIKPSKTIMKAVEAAKD